MSRTPLDSALISLPVVLLAALALLLGTAPVFATESPFGERMILTPGLDQRCNIDAVPAATLLFPYFSADLTTGRNVTTFSITNADSAPHLARVTLWTNWALPTLSFDVYLGGYDEAVFNVADLLTGKAFDPETYALPSPGPMSADTVAFPGCAATVYRQGAFEPAFHPGFPASTDRRRSFDNVHQAHLGHGVGWPEMQWAERTPLIWATPQQVDTATGYITVDVVNQCSQSFPSDPGYFVHGGRGIASNANVLLGELILYEPAGARAAQETAVHIRADEHAFAPGDYTFYGRYVGGTAADDRQPLGTVFATRYLVNLSFAESINTYVLVWRDTKQPPGGPVPFGLKPSWYPLGGEPVLMFDEAMQVSVERQGLAASLATQSVDLDFLGAPYNVGWMRIDLNHNGSDLFGGAAQGWVTTLMGAALRSPGAPIHVGVGCRAFRLESPCDYR